MQPATEGQSDPTRGRGRRLHLQALARRLVPPSIPLSRPNNEVNRAMVWLFPWTATTYPGPRRGLPALLGGRVGWYSVRHWLRGTRPIPGWAAAILADYLEARGRVALELAAELRALPVRPDKRRAGNRTGDNEQSGDCR